MRACVCLRAFAHEWAIACVFVYTLCSMCLPPPSHIPYVVHTNTRTADTCAGVQRTLFGMTGGGRIRGGGCRSAWHVTGRGPPGSTSDLDGLTCSRRGWNRGGRRRTGTGGPGPGGGPASSGSDGHSSPEQTRTRRRAEEEACSLCTSLWIRARVASTGVDFHCDRREGRADVSYVQ